MRLEELDQKMPGHRREFVADRDRSEEASVLGVQHDEGADPPPEQEQGCRLALVFLPDVGTTELDGRRDRIDGALQRALITAACSC